MSMPPPLDENSPYQQQDPLPKLEPKQECTQPNDLVSPFFCKAFAHPHLLIILMLISHILYLNNKYFSYKTVYDVFLMFFVWFPIGNSLIKSTGTLKYSLVALFNIAVLHFCMFMLAKYLFRSYDFLRMTPFALFEVILFTSVNKEESTSLCFTKIPNKYFRWIIFLLTWTIHGWKAMWLPVLLYAFFFEATFTNVRLWCTKTKEAFLKQRGEQLTKAENDSVAALTNSQIKEGSASANNTPHAYDDAKSVLETPIGVEKKVIDISSN